MPSPTPPSTISINPGAAISDTAPGAAEFSSPIGSAGTKVTFGTGAYVAPVPSPTGNIPAAGNNNK
ncbi:unnamed protein product [Ectocarpus sp. CCAP 1310/34]|nr:unnamed protein product [Ectocarpus sp. CCAP 1310/34]